MRIAIFATLIPLCCFNVFGQESKTVYDIFYGDPTVNYTPLEIKGLSLDVNYNTKKNKLPVIVFFHGGGLTSDDKYIPNVLYNNNLIVVSPNYRLSPSVKCPTYIEDAAASVAWVFKNISQYGGDPTKIYLTGFSAGAFLANMVFWDKSYLAKYEIDCDNLAGILSISSQMTTHFQILNERGIVVNSASNFIDRYSPLFNVRQTNTPVTFIVGDRNLDMSGRYYQNDSIFRTLQSLGCKNIELFELNGFGHDENLVDASLKTYISKKINILDSINKIDSDCFVNINSLNGCLKIENSFPINNLEVFNALGQNIYNNKFISHGKYSVNIQFVSKILLVRMLINGVNQTRKIISN